MVKITFSQDKKLYNVAKPERASDLFCKPHLTNQQKQYHRNKHAQGLYAYQDGIKAEELACEHLRSAGWKILFQRARTPQGEIDIVAQQEKTHPITQQKETILCFVEVKKRRSLTEAVYSLPPPQCARLFRAAEYLLQNFIQGHYDLFRFDLITFDKEGKALWLQDIIRQM